MNATDLRAKSVEELQNELKDLLSDQFKYRMQKATGQLGQTHLMKEVRRDIARVKTVISEKLKAGE